MADIEYNIKFPIDSSEQFSPDNEDGFVHVREQTRPPVVFLLGWIGCKDRHLCRYSDLYNEKGFITVRCIIPPKTLILHHWSYPELVQRLLNLIPDMSLDEHPIFFHVFSNGGCFTYQYVVNEMRLQNLNFDVRGCIMDSAPGKIRSSSIFKTIMTLPIVQPVRLIFAIVCCIWMYILNLIMICFHNLVDEKYLSGDVWGNLSKADTSVPQLFIYSADDKFVPHTDIDEFLELRTRSGVDVTKCKFDSSPHVLHLANHKDEYLQAISLFTHKCLKTL